MTNGQQTKIMLTEFWLFFTLTPPHTHTHNHRVHSQLSKVALNSLSSKQTQQTNTVCICVAPVANVMESKQEELVREGHAGFALLISICVNINAKRHDLSQLMTKCAPLAELKRTFWGSCCVLLLRRTHHSCGMPPLWSSSVVHKTQRVIIVGQTRAIKTMIDAHGLTQMHVFIPT